MHDHPHLAEYQDHLFVWPKGATFWGETLPYVETDKSGKRWIAYGPWWTDKRLEKLSEWSIDAMRQLDSVFGADPRLRILAEARVRCDRATSDGRQLTLREIMGDDWRATPQEAVRIDDLAETYAATREWARNWLSEVAAAKPQLREDLPGDAADWNSQQMAAAAIRVPKLLVRLIETGRVLAATGLMPERMAV